MRSSGESICNRRVRLILPGQVVSLSGDIYPIEQYCLRTCIFRYFVIKLLHLQLKFFIIEFAFTIEESKHLEVLCDSALLALGQYTLQQMHWNRFGRLLVALRSLALHQFGVVLQNLFKNVINEILLDNKIN